MNKSNIDLFKLALIEGLSNKIDKQIAACTEDVVISPAHERAMNKIISYSKNQVSNSIRLKRAIAILVAAALLLTGCVVIYRDEICDFIEEICDSFMAIKSSESGDGNKILEDIYELTYLPEGYRLDDTFTVDPIIRSLYIGKNNTITLEQFPLDRGYSYLDIENGYTKILEITNWEIYYRNSSTYHYYIWSVDNYYLKIKCDFELSIEELQKIVDGAKIK